MSQDDLFHLLPAVHRDQDQGGALRALMGVLESQIQALQSNIGLLYDSWFIETCPDWIVPYIADLVGVEPALSASDSPGLRTLVANTVGYQRARGTLATVGHAATAVSGWPVLAVDLEQRAVYSHGFRGPASASPGTLRIARFGAVEGAAAMAQIESGMRLSGRGARVQHSRRTPAPELGRIGLLVWRLQGHAVEWAEPASRGAGHYTFHPLGKDSPLFTAPSRLPASGNPPAGADMPQPLTRAMLAASLSAGAAGPVIRVRRGGVWHMLARRDMTAADLSDWPVRAAPAQDDGVAVLIDPELGRLVVEGAVERVAVDYAYGAARALGGGPYDRSDRLVLPEEKTWVARVCGTRQDLPSRVNPPGRSRHVFASLLEALENCPASATDVLIEIADNAIHRLAWPAGRTTPPDAGARRGLVDWSHRQCPSIACGGRQLAIQAMDGFRPCLEGDLALDCREAAGSPLIAGVWWNGTVFLRGHAKAVFLDCTLWPEAGAAIHAGPDTGDPTLLLDRCITGPLRWPSRDASLVVRRSIVDGFGGRAIAGAAPDIYAQAPQLDRVTVLGGLRTTDAPSRTNTLITGLIETPAVPGGLESPAAAALFRSRRLGSAAYAVLADACPLAIAAGASDGDELGAFHGWRRRSRADSLSRAVDAYLPEGLSCRTHFVT